MTTPTPGHVARRPSALRAVAIALGWLLLLPWIAFLVWVIFIW